MLKRFPKIILVFALFLVMSRFLFCCLALASEDKAAGKPVQFRFVVDSKTRALIDYIKIVNNEGKIIASLDVGDKSDQSGENHIIVDVEDRWGPAKDVDDRSARCVNENNGTREHSRFLLVLSQLPNNNELKIVIKYKDIGDDLLPVEIFDGEEFRRIAQILMENTGEWLEEEFYIPAIDIK